MNTIISRLENNISQVLLGKPEKIRLVVCVLLAGEHVLIEDVPGVGKTLLGRALARSIDSVFKRIQFTPDLLPSDITGGSVYNTTTGEFTFQPGPVFANIILADEINRTTPRTQSALLEAMAEQQVSSDRQTYPLPNPFMVIATQNPLEFEGTYPLPESQLDRFLMRINLGYPPREVEFNVLDVHHSHDMVERLEPVVTATELESLKNEVRNVVVEDSLRTYIIDLVDKTRKSEELRLGVSTRGALALYRAAQARAFCDSRSYCVPDDIISLALPVLAHRVIPAGYFQNNRMEYAQQVIQDIVDQTDIPC